ncbi:MAG: BrnT family toxin [Gallionellaceae bacterium]|jgi:uncharacterized DUF497 family protein|nr:BrnT family toxin [Gallionellaceae bacterium]
MKRIEIAFDPAKNRLNIRDHHISLADVEGVFFDPFALTREDRDHDEARFVTLGTDGLGRLLVVAYMYRGDGIRIISARRAEPHERRSYEEGR